MLAGGAESMTQAPYAVRNIRFGTKLVRHNDWLLLGPFRATIRALLTSAPFCHISPSQGVSPIMEDTLWQGLTDSLCNVRPVLSPTSGLEPAALHWSHRLSLHPPPQTPMGVTAENLASKYNISRQDCDEFALSSQHKWKKAHVGLLRVARARARRPRRSLSRDA